MLTRAEYHELRNQMAIAIGMTELQLKYMKKMPPSEEVMKLIERAEKAFLALEKAQEIVAIGHERARSEDPS